MSILDFGLRSQPGTCEKQEQSLWSLSDHCHPCQTVISIEGNEEIVSGEITAKKSTISGKVYN